MVTLVAVNQTRIYFLHQYVSLSLFTLSGLYNGFLVVLNSSRLITLATRYSCDVGLPLTLRYSKAQVCSISMEIFNPQTPFLVKHSF